MPREVINAETCRSCGACCVAPSSQPEYCDVTAEDMRRLGKRFVRLHVIGPSPFDRLATALSGCSTSAAIRTEWREQTTGPLKGWELNTCVALRGSVMNRVGCRVYDKRPRVCERAVKPGDNVCREIRRAFAQQLDAEQERTDSEKTEP